MNHLRENWRILLVDDMPSIHEDFRKILAPEVRDEAALDALESALFDKPEQGRQPRFELDDAMQGQEGLERIRAAVAEGRPYALAFVDMRMPPGWDGLETIERLWGVDPRLQIVICTAYSDHSWDEIAERLEIGDRLLILKKPFDAVEVRQLASTLCTKWTLTAFAQARLEALEAAVGSRTRELTTSNEALRREITERKQLEAQLVQSEKLASIGQLAAGVAHEINNPIGFVHSNFEMLRGYVGRMFGLLDIYQQAEPQMSPRELAERLATAREQAELDFLREDIPCLVRESQEGFMRVRRIVRDLKNFSRADSGADWQLADLHQGIESTLNIVGSETRGRADIVKDFGELPEVECQPLQINQVVLNLVVNAVQAMGSERGRICIRTRAEGDRVWIEVEDNGCGIPPESLPRIFEPFYTTKPIGQGTGLGLSLSHGIVSQHGGTIDVRSEVGRGTCIRVTLPVRRAGSGEGG